MFKISYIADILSLPTPISDEAYTIRLLMSIAVWGAYDPLVFPEVDGALL
jgi:hypothetical protein